VVTLILKKYVALLPAMHALTRLQIIDKSLQDLNYIRRLPTEVQTYVLDSVITSTEAAFGVLDLLFYVCTIVDDDFPGISCIVLIISLVSSLYVKEMLHLPQGRTFVS